MIEAENAFAFLVTPWPNCTDLPRVAEFVITFAVPLEGGKRNPVRGTVFSCSLMMNLG
jgi:hypothetical protein